MALDTRSPRIGVPHGHRFSLTLSLEPCHGLRRHRRKDRGGDWHSMGRWSVDQLPDAHRLVDGRRSRLDSRCWDLGGHASMATPMDICIYLVPRSRGISEGAPPMGCSIRIGAVGRLGVAPVATTTSDVSLKTTLADPRSRRRCQVWPLNRWYRYTQPPATAGSIRFPRLASIGDNTDLRPWHSPRLETRFTQQI